jgi:hypothetical protein
VRIRKTHSFILGVEVLEMGTGQVPCTQPDTCARGHGFYNREYRSVDIDKLSYRERISSNTIIVYALVI